MKKPVIIVVAVLSLLTSTIFLYKKFSSNNKSQNPLTQQTTEAIAQPLDPSTIREKIKNPETMTRCLVVGDANENEYFIHTNNIYVKTTNKQGEKITSYFLKVENEVFNWDSQSQEGSSFIIPNSDQIKANPNLKEYLKLVPNTYQFDEEGINELKQRGYQTSCEVVTLDLKIFEPPYITFKKLLLEKSSVPESSPQLSSPQP